MRRGHDHLDRGRESRNLVAGFHFCSIAILRTSGVRMCGSQIDHLRFGK
jgi:hypothetical protein